MKVRFLLAASLLATSQLSAGTAIAQTTATTRPAPAPGVIASHADWPKADPADVKDPASIINALSDTISGTAGQPRNWDRLRSLFIPVAGRMIVTRVPKEGPADITLLSPDDYAARTSAGGNAAFYEHPLANTVETFGRMTHVYESYELKHTRQDAAPYGRGINSWELLFDGTRYWIVQVYWDSERPANPIPAKFLQGTN